MAASAVIGEVSGSQSASAQCAMALKALLTRYNGVLPLDLICNAKQFLNEDQEIQTVYQLETAMGAAISLFEGAQAICVGEKYRRSAAYSFQPVRAHR